MTNKKKLSYDEALKEEQRLQALPRMERLRLQAAQEKKDRRRSYLKNTISSIMFISVIVGWILYDDPEKQQLEEQKILVQQPIAAAIDSRQDKIERQFSGWDGSHRDLVRRTKRQMHDPSSFEHVKTKYVEKDGHLMVVMSYRGTNGFGAKILSSVNAFYTIDGDYEGQVSE